MFRSTTGAPSHCWFWFTRCVGPMSSSSFSAEEWGRTRGPRAWPQPCPDLSQLHGAVPAWPLDGSWDPLLQGAPAAYKGPTLSFAALLISGSRSVEICCPGASEAQAGNSLSNALAPAPNAKAKASLAISVAEYNKTKGFYGWLCNTKVKLGKNCMQFKPVYNKHLKSQNLLACCMNRKAFLLKRLDRNLKGNLQWKSSCGGGGKKKPRGIPEERREHSNMAIRYSCVKNRWSAHHN